MRGDGGGAAARVRRGFRRAAFARRPGAVPRGAARGWGTPNMENGGATLVHGDFKAANIVFRRVASPSGRRRTFRVTARG